MTAQPVALLRTVGQAGERDDGDWVGHTTTQTGRCQRTRYGTHSEGVVPDRPRAPVYDVSRCRAGSGGHRRSVGEPLVQLYLAARNLRPGGVLAGRVQRDKAARSPRRDRAIGDGIVVQDRHFFGRLVELGT
jgi:hypothetical protein